MKYLFIVIATVSFLLVGCGNEPTKENYVHFDYLFTEKMNVGDKVYLNEGVNAQRLSQKSYSVYTCVAFPESYFRMIGYIEEKHGNKIQKTITYSSGHGWYTTVFILK